MDRRIINWGMSGLLLTSVAMGATTARQAAASGRKTVRS